MNIIAIALFCAFLLLTTIGYYLTAKKSGAVSAYILFSWVPLLFGVIWMSLEFYLVPLNVLLLLLIIGASLLLSLVGLPMMLIRYRKKLSAEKVLSMVVAGFLYGIPSILFIMLTITGTK